MKNVGKKIVAVLTGIMMTCAVLFTGNTTNAKAEEYYGTAGRLYFANGYSVGLNYADAYDRWAQQSVTDAWDSAAYSVSDEGVTLIADHAAQGFSIIKKYGVGSVVTIADAWGGSTNYVCISLYTNAYWADGYCMLPDGRDAWEGDSNFWMKTCNANGTNTVSYWVPQY